MVRENFVLSFLLVLAVYSVSGAAIATFDDLTLPAESYWNGTDSSGGFRSGGAIFKNNYNPQWDYWDGFAYSNITDTIRKDLDSQYNAIAGSGQGSSANYGVVFVGWQEPPMITLTTAQTLEGLYVTNNNYAYYSMLNGNPFSKKFGGQTGKDEDWFKLTITGKDKTGEITGTVDFYLADFRFADNSKDYILNSWAFVDLSPLGEVAKLEFALDSSDKGMFGMNTPGYLCIDTIIPEPVTLVLLGLGGLFINRRKS